MNLQTKNPIRKVTFASMSGAVIIILVWLVRVLFKFEIPGEVVAAITTVVGFFVSYFVKSAPEDLIPTDVPQQGET